MELIKMMCIFYGILGGIDFIISLSLFLQIKKLEKMNKSNK